MATGQIEATKGKRRGMNYTHVFLAVILAEAVLGWAIFEAIHTMEGW